jgi:hypothetical protein
MKRALLVSLALLTLSGSVCSAGARRFTYVYEATTSPPGSLEFENWATWKTHQPDDHGYSEAEFRHEVEFGITDHFQAAVYLADYAYERGNGWTYSDSAIELMYNLTSPATDPIGLALYAEIKAGDRLLELESKVIAQKNFGRLVFAYNATLEAVWQGKDLEEAEGEFQQSLGASYEFNPRVSAGVEFLHEIEIPDWSRGERGFFFGGPNVSVRAGKWWTTVTALAQLTRAGGEPDLQIRAIVGYTF